MTVHGDVGRRQHLLSMRGLPYWLLHRAGPDALPWSGPHWWECAQWLWVGRGGAWLLDVGRAAPAGLRVPACVGTIFLMISRTRVALGPTNHACQLCGQGTPELIESRKVRRLRDRLNAAWDPEVRLTEVCPACGARTRVEPPLSGANA